MKSYLHKTLRMRSIIPLCLLLMLASCGKTSQTTHPQVTPVVEGSASFQTISITAVDYGYVMPEKLAIQTGIVDLALVNNGSEAHQAQVARLDDGVTTNEVYNALVTQKNQAAAFSLFTFVGGPDTIAPGYGQEALLDLSAGQYVLLCFVVSPDGIAHVSKGMIHFFTVTARPGQSVTPASDGTVVMQDDGYVLPAVLTQVRTLTLQVTNRGTQSHELNIVRLAQGKYAQDIVAFFRAPSGSPPFEEMGGLAALQPGGSAWIKVHLEPGNYAVISSIPDPRTGQSQLAQGMMRSFSVS